MLPIDQTLTCTQCGERFLYSAFELARFGVLRHPRCGACRANTELPALASPGEEFADQVLICCACAAPFRWTAGEQAFFHEQGWTPPRRCKGCRTARRQRVGTVRRAGA